MTPQAPRSHQGLLVGQSDVLPRLDRGGSRNEPRSTDNGGHHHVDLCGGGGGDQSLDTAEDFRPLGGKHRSQLPGQFLGRNRHQPRGELLDLPLQQLQIAPGGERHHLEPVPMGGDDLKSADPDGTGGTEYAELLHITLV